MAINNWEYGDNFGPLTDIVNEVVDKTNSCLDLASSSKFGVLQADTDVYDSKTLGGVNWENITDKIIAKRNEKSVDVSIFITADWVSGSTSFPGTYNLKDLYKGEEGSPIIGMFSIGKYTGGAQTQILSPNGYIDIDSNGYLSFALEDGLLAAVDSVIIAISISFNAKNDISAFL